MLFLSDYSHSDDPPYSSPSSESDISSRWRRRKAGMSDEVRKALEAKAMER